MVAGNVGQRFKTLNGLASCELFAESGLQNQTDLTRMQLVMTPDNGSSIHSFVVTAPDALHECLR